MREGKITSTKIKTHYVTVLCFQRLLHLNPMRDNVNFQKLMREGNLSALALIMFSLE